MMFATVMVLTPEATARVSHEPGKTVNTFSNKQQKNHVEYRQQKHMRILF